MPSPASDASPGASPAGRRLSVAERGREASRALSGVAYGLHGTSNPIWVGLSKADRAKLAKLSVALSEACRRHRYGEAKPAVPATLQAAGVVLRPGSWPTAAEAASGPAAAQGGAPSREAAPRLVRMSSTEVFDDDGVVLEHSVCVAKS